jgi:hypothetical protein
LGIVIDVKPLLWNEDSPILVTELPIVTNITPEQSWYALLPILVTEFPIVTDEICVLD